MGAAFGVLEKLADAAYPRVNCETGWKLHVWKSPTHPLEAGGMVCDHLGSIGPSDVEKQSRLDAIDALSVVTLHHIFLRTAKRSQFQN